MPDTFHLLEPGEDEDHSFEHFVSVLGISLGTKAIFRSLSDFESDWRNWIKTSFGPLLAPSFVAAHHHGLASHVLELCEEDRRLDQNLSSQSREASVAAARTFFEGKEEMRGHQVWARFADKVEEGSTSGHLPIVFALQSALYHLPLAAALEAYAWFEFRSRTGEANPAPPSEGEREIFNEIQPALSVAVRGNSSDSPEAGDHSDEDPPSHLQVV